MGVGLLSFVDWIALLGFINYIDYNDYNQYSDCISAAPIVIVSTLCDLGGVIMFLGRFGIC